MSNELILREDNIRLVMQQAPQAWRDNQQSHDRCLASCQTLLDTIEAEGMNDELDQKAETYIRKSRNTVKKMNEQRSAVTKLFDEIRAVFTTLENDVDPAKKGSIPFRLQEQRNAYAARKQREAEERRRAEQERQRLQLMRDTYRADVEADYRQTFNGHLNQKYNQLAGLMQSITLDNFDNQAALIESFATGLPDDYARFLPSGTRIPAGLDVAGAGSHLEGVRRRGRQEGRGDETPGSRGSRQEGAGTPTPRAGGSRQGPGAEAAGGDGRPLRPGQGCHADVPAQDASPQAHRRHRPARVPRHPQPLVDHRRRHPHGGRAGQEVQDPAPSKTRVSSSPPTSRMKMK